MRIRLELEAEDNAYDEMANVENITGYTKQTQAVLNNIAKIEREGAPLSIIKSFDLKIDVTTSFRQIALSLDTETGKEDENFIRMCAKAWHNLWDYFELADLREKCFPKKGCMELTDDEYQFIREYLGKVCKPAEIAYDGNGNTENKKGEVRSFLDKRKKMLSDDEKANVQWVATNLYEMLRKRMVISDDIRKMFFTKTEDKSYMREKRFEDIQKYVGHAKERSMTKKEKDKCCLSIKELEAWADGLASEINKVVEKWENIFLAMDSLKNDDGDRYKENEITHPEELLNDGIKYTEEYSND